jgi:small conductance mechanosensitive channel
MKIDSIDTPLGNSIHTITEVVQDPKQLLSADIWKKATEYLINLSVNITVAILVLIVGFWLARRIKTRLAKFFERKDFEASVKTFMTDFVVWSFRILVVITALSRLGIEMTSFLALLGAAGLAIGMAFSGTLGNFAGGIILLVMRQYRIGDVVIANGELGKVTDIHIFNTVLLTYDNKTIIIPNGEVIKSSITNFTKQQIRRVDFDFGLSYSHDFQEAKRIILEIIKRNELILLDPEPFIGIKNLGNSSVDITCRVWTSTENYWSVYYYLSETLYKELPARGFPFPFPQLDVHLKKPE